MNKLADHIYRVQLDREGRPILSDELLHEMEAASIERVAGGSGPNLVVAGLNAGDCPNETNSGQVCTNGLNCEGSTNTDDCRNTRRCGRSTNTQDCLNSARCPADGIPL